MVESSDFGKSLVGVEKTLMLFREEIFVISYVVTKCTVFTLMVDVCLIFIFFFPKLISPTE